MCRLFIFILLSFLCVGEILCRHFDFEKDIGGIRGLASEEVAWLNGAILNESLNTLKSGDSFSFGFATFYVMGGIIIKDISNVDIKLQGKILFAGNPKTWPRDDIGNVLDSLIFYNCSNISISGAFNYGSPALDLQHLSNSTYELPHLNYGVLDGNGAHWWHFPFMGYLLHFENRPRILRMISCRDVKIEKILFLNSPYWTTLFENVTNLEISSVEIINRRTRHNEHTPLDMSALNTDGIDVTGNNVYVHDVTIWTQDDCIAVKDGSQNMLFQNLNASGLGLAIGSIGNSYNRNITFRNAYLYRTVKAIYIKFRKADDEVRDSRMHCPCIYDRHPYGLIEDVLFENIIIDEAEQYAIWAGPAQQVNFRDPSSCSVSWPMIPTARCSGQPNGLLRRVKFKDILIIKPKGIGVLMGTPDHPFEDMLFENVIVEFNCTGKLLSLDSADNIFQARIESLLVSDEYVFVGFLGLSSLGLFFFISRRLKVNILSILLEIALLIIAIIIYGALIHSQLDLLNPNDYHICSNILSSKATGDTWPVPSCFQDETNPAAKPVDLKCLNEIDYYHSFWGSRWLRFIPHYLILGIFRLVTG